MDRMTTSGCEKPYGRASFARYESLGKILKLWVEYTWVPPRCEECKVYVHYLNECAKKVNTVSKVRWQIAGNRRNNRVTSSNFRQGPVGGYNVKRGFNNNRGDSYNKGNLNLGNVGTRDVNKKSEPVNKGNVGKVDESVITNDKGEPANKGKNKITQDVTSSDGKNKSVNADPKLNMAAKNTNNKNGRVASNSNTKANGSKKGDTVSSKASIGDQMVTTSNRFDLLSGEGVSEAIDPWNEVKAKVANACDTNVPIEENFEREIKNLSSQIVQISRNLDKNSKVYAEKRLKASDVNVQNDRDEDLSHIWAETISGLSIKTANNSLWSVIQRLVFGAAVYYIWQERNGRIFRKEFRSEEAVFKVIVDTVRYKLMGLKIKKSREAVKAAAIWKILLHGINGDGSLGYNAGIDDPLMFVCSGSAGYAWGQVYRSVTKYLIGVRLASYALQNRTQISALAVCFWIMRCIDFHKYLVCWFCLGTGFWKCNQVFDYDDDELDIIWFAINGLCTTGESENSGTLSYCILSVVKVPSIIDKFLLAVLVNNLRWSIVMVVGWCLCNWLCTTDFWISFCAGLLFSSWEFSTLCTTEPISIFCAGLLFWYRKSIWQIALHYNDFDIISVLVFCVGRRNTLVLNLQVSFWIAAFKVETLVLLLTNGVFSSCTLFPWSNFFPQGFVCQGFLMRQVYWVMLILDDSPLFKTVFSWLVIHSSECFGWLLCIRFSVYLEGLSYAWISY
ncbi:reverse transcriptase domain, Reverse transcriptase zinc-binding domain protein [Artemisia annua]|uniref:Reverse transcriptase domain, Reverse transcriptase zinc-binding domain protein n=1 Tax=Artemisia annua TaxID=35608 RepID=A0A2U1LJ04_ARTAN|nr:reverse transcriptase domain, Reverse transcriptase zinc-binding domain protein [Artemisia annua]